MTTTVTMQELNGMAREAAAKVIERHELTTEVLEYLGEYRDSCGHRMHQFAYRNADGLTYVDCEVKIHTGLSNSRMTRKTYKPRKRDQQPRNRGREVIYTGKVVKPNTAIDFVYDDGGRNGHRNVRAHVGDCGCRALSIIMQRDYWSLYDYLDANFHGSPSRGLSRDVVHKIMRDEGYEYVACANPKGDIRRLRRADLPDGRLLVWIRDHYTAVIDGVIHDTYDCSKHGRAHVMGYWYKPERD